MTANQKELVLELDKVLQERYLTSHQQRNKILDRVNQFTFPRPLYENGLPVKLGERPGIRKADGHIQYLEFPLTGIAYWPEEEYIELIAEPYQHYGDYEDWYSRDDSPTDVLTVGWNERLVMLHAEDAPDVEVPAEQELLYSTEGVILNKHHCNAAIQVTVLPEEDMRAAKFTDYKADTWYYGRRLFDDISFNISIAKDGSDWHIDVLDEAFGQPYDFQAILHKDPTFAYALKVANCVEEQMSYLRNKGIISGHNRGEYI